MRINTITNQHRRDFTAVFECEHCGHTEVGRGYDDRYFHEHVVPDMPCTKCGEKAGADYAARATKYPDGMQI